MNTAAEARIVWSILKETVSEWSDDNASRLAASLAFYTLLSIAPLMVLAVFVVGLAYGEDAARGQIATQLARVVGPQAAVGIQFVVENARAPASFSLGSVVGTIALIVGASGVFGELRTALNEIWEAPDPSGRGVLDFVRRRLLAFVVVMGVALLLLASTLFSAALSAFGRLGARVLPGGAFLWHATNVGVSLAVISLLFALMFKYLPDVEIAWRDVWVGASITALLFVIGRSLLGVYFGQFALSSAYGAAGSLVVLIVWVYYSAQILFFGAELTQVWARRHRQTGPKAEAQLLS